MTLKEIFNDTGKYLMNTINKVGGKKMIDSEKDNFLIELASLSQCAYISDLRFPESKQNTRVINALNFLIQKDYLLSTWEYVCHYITCKDPQFLSILDYKEFIIDFLNTSIKGE